MVEDVAEIDATNDVVVLKMKKTKVAIVYCPNMISHKQRKISRSIVFVVFFFMTIHFFLSFSFYVYLENTTSNHQTYAADIFFSQTWQDYRLRFPDNLTADYRLLPTSWLNSMWRPDSFFKNAKKVTFQDITIPNHYIWLYKDKSILYMVK